MLPGPLRRSLKNLAPGYGVLLDLGAFNLALANN